jgi:hypothetical protein
LNKTQKAKVRDTLKKTMKTLPVKNDLVTDKTE